MSKTINPNATSRTRYNAEFKTGAFSLVEKIGIGAAAMLLGMHASQLYN